MICILTRLVKFTDPSTCREILKILLARAANYLIVIETEIEAADDGGRKEITLMGDEFLSDQMDFASYVLKKGVLLYEVGEGQPTTETCNVIREALAAVTLHMA